MVNAETQPTCLGTDLCSVGSLLNPPSICCQSINTMITGSLQKTVVEAYCHGAAVRKHLVLLEPQNLGGYMSLPRLAIEYLALASLRLDAKNARLHNEKQVRQIAKSIEAFGFNVPLLVDASLQVVAGHGRLKACERLGIDQVPVIRLEHLSEQQQQAFMIADNRLTENSRWIAGCSGSS